MLNECLISNFFFYISGKGHSMTYDGNNRSVPFPTAGVILEESFYRCQLQELSADMFLELDQLEVMDLSQNEISSIPDAKMFQNMKSLR